MSRTALRPALRMAMRGGARRAPSPLLTDLVGYWKLDESSDGSAPVTRNDSVGTSHMTDNNTTASAAAKINNGASFVATNTEYLSVAANPTLVMGDIDFTVAAWVNATTLFAVNEGIVGHYLSAGDQRAWLLWHSSDHSRFVFQVSADGGTGFTQVIANTLGAPNTGTYYFVVAWHDATANKIYIQVNGGGVDSANHATGVHSSTGAITIGALANPTYYWNGIIDEVGIWKRVLTSDERATLYNSGSGLSYPF